MFYDFTIEKYFGLLYNDNIKDRGNKQVLYKIILKN